MIHLAIMRQPWLNLVMVGSKTIESRANQKRNPPYGQIHKGDLIYFKESGDFVVYLRAEVSKVLPYEGKMVQIKMREFAKEIGITEEYIKEKADAQYLTLIWLTKVTQILPFPFSKHDQRSWICDFKHNPQTDTILEGFRIKGV
jgi:ASC-1-like (ASCH) protein